jgi:hypothetical protein
MAHLQVPSEPYQPFRDETLQTLDDLGRKVGRVEGDDRGKRALHGGGREKLVNVNFFVIV